MILISYKYIVSILVFVVAVQTDEQQILKKNELSSSLSNEQYTQYQYERTIHSATTENNQDNSVTTNINTKFVQQKYSSSELDLNNSDTNDLNSAINKDINSKINILHNKEAENINDYESNSIIKSSNTEVNTAGATAINTLSGSINSLTKNTQATSNKDLTDTTNGEGYDSNGNIQVNDNGFVKTFQSSNYYNYMQHITDQDSGNTNQPNPAGTSEDVDNLILQRSMSSMNLQTIATSMGTFSNSPGSQPFMPNGNTIDTSSSVGAGINTPTNMNGSPATTTNSLTGVTTANMINTPSPNTGPGSPNSNLNGGGLSTATSMSGTNGSPLNVSPTSPNVDSTSVPNDISTTNGLSSYPYMSITYPTAGPGNMNNGVPNYPPSTVPNTGSGAPNSSPNGGMPTVATPSTNSNGSPPSPYGGSIGNTNGQAYDSNGNIQVNDNGFVKTFQSSNYYNYMQHITDQDSGNTNQPNPAGTSEDVDNLILQRSMSSMNLQTIATSMGTFSNSPGSQPFMPNGNTIDTSSSVGAGINTPTNMNGSPATTTNSLTGVTKANMINTPSPNTGPGSPNSNLNGGGLSTATSLSGTNGSPTSPNVDSTSVPNDISTTNGLSSYPYMSITYPTAGPGNMNNGVPNYHPSTVPNTGSGAPNSSPNGEMPTVATPSTNSNGSPPSPYGGSIGNTNGQAYDSNGNIQVNDNGFVKTFQSSNYYNYMQHITDQDSGNTNQPNPAGTSEDVDNLILQRSMSSMNLQTIATSMGTFSNSPGSQPFMPNGNTIDTSSSVGAGINTPTNMNGSPATTTNSLTGVTTANMINTPSPNTGPGSPNSNLNGGGLSTATSLSGTNGSPTSPNVDSTSVPNDISTTNGLSSYPYMSITYPTAGPGNMNNGVPNYPPSTVPNTGSGAPNSSPNGGMPTVATPSTNSNGSPPSPYGGSIGNTNGQAYDSNGNIQVNDNGFVKTFQSSNYYNYMQHITDQDSGNTNQPNPAGTSEDVDNLILQRSMSSMNLQTIATSMGTFSNSPGSQPFMPNGNTIDTSSSVGAGINTPTNMNGSPATTTNSLTGVTKANMINTPSPNTGPGSPNSNLNGGGLSTATSLSGTNGSPTSPNVDSTSVPNDISTTNGLSSYPYMSITYPTAGPGNMNNGVPNYHPSTVPNTGSGAPNSSPNGEMPTVATPSTNSNGSPPSPYGGSIGNTNGQAYDSNGNIQVNDNGFVKTFQSSNYYNYMQHITDQDSGNTNQPNPAGTSEDVDNLILQRSMSSMNLQTIATSMGTFSNSPGSQPFMPNGNTIDTSSSVGAGINTPTNMNGSPATTTNSLTGVTTANMINTPSPNTGPGSPNSNLNGGGLSTATSLSGTNGSPTSPNVDSTSVPNDISTTNGLSSYPYMSITYPTAGPGNMNNGVPNYPPSTVPNTGSGAPNSSPNGGMPTVATPSTNSNGSPPSPYGGSIGSTNGQAYDSNGNIQVNDNGFVKTFQSSNYYNYMQHITDQDSGNKNQPNPAGTSEDVDNLILQRSMSSMNLQTIATSMGTFSNSPGSQPFMPNGNTIDTSSSVGAGINTPTNMNGSPATTTNSLTGVTTANMINTPSPNTGPGSPNSNLNGGGLSTATSMSGTNGSPLNVSPTSPNVDSTSVPNDISTTNGLSSYPYMSITYPTAGPGNMNNGVPNYPPSTVPNTGSGAPNSSPNGGMPTVATPSTNSNGSPPSPYGGSIGSTNGQAYDSNGNIQVNDNGFVKTFQSSNYYNYMQHITDQDSGNTNQPNPAGTSEDVDNLILQRSMSSMNLQTIATSMGTFSNSPDNPKTMSPYTVSGVPIPSLNGEISNSISPSTPNADLNPMLNAGVPSFKGSEDLYSILQYEYQPLIGQIPDNYESSNYNFGYDLQNMDLDEVLNDGEINRDNRYISDNYDQINNDGAYIPRSNEDSEFYNEYFYDKSSVNFETIQSSNGDYNTLSYGNIVNDDFDNSQYVNENLPEPLYDKYASNLNTKFENSQLQYGPPSIGYSFSYNDIAPYDTDIYSSNGMPMSGINTNMYNYGNRVNIPYGNDQSGIGIYDINPNNNQLSGNDFNIFPNTQISTTTDSYSDIDMPSGTYDFVDNVDRGKEIMDSNYMGQVSENTVYNGNGYMQSANVPEYNQLNADYSTTYLSSSSSTGANVDINVPNGPYLSSQLINSDYNLLTSNNLDKQSSDLNSLLIESAQLNNYMYAENDASNVNTQIEGLAEDGSNSILIKTTDDRFNSIQSTILSKTNALDVGQNVYGANGQVIGKIYKPSNETRKNSNLHKYSGSSIYSSSSDSVLSDDIDALGNDIKKAARDVAGNIYNKTKDAYDITKAVGKGIGNAVRNVTSDVANGVKNAADNIYQGSKDVAKDVRNAAVTAADDGIQAANNAYQDTKYVVNGMGDVASEAADGIQQTAKNAYQGTKDVANGV